MKKMILDLKGIKEYQQNRAPYLLIDHPISVDFEEIGIIEKS